MNVQRYRQQPALLGACSLSPLLQDECTVLLLYDAALLAPYVQAAGGGAGAALCMILDVQTTQGEMVCRTTVVPRSSNYQPPFDDLTWPLLKKHMRAMQCVDREQGPSLGPPLHACRMLPGRYSVRPHDVR